jgi:ribA/ribD-fused uncharacterized protein
LGRQIKNFNEEKWNDIKKQIVFRGNYLKFSQNKKLYDILLGTDNKHLAEASSTDNIWGIGINIKDASKGIPWRGQNLLEIY